MSPRKRSPHRPDNVDAAIRRAWLAFGVQVRDARIARRWSVAELADRAGVSRTATYLLEAGRTSTSETVARVASALGRRLEFNLIDPRRKADLRASLSGDPVHSIMGEFEARHLRPGGFGVGMDEPYQHFQFAGRADLVAWDLERAALLHIENRTRFPDFQEMAGSFNAKRAYLPAALAARLGVSRWASQTHVIAALWSAEVLHALRLRTESFRSICPHGIDSFAAWWGGQPPTSGSTSTLIVLDPLAVGRQRVFIGLEDALSARPRHRGYADVARLLGEAAA